MVGSKRARVQSAAPDPFDEGCHELRVGAATLGYQIRAGDPMVHLYSLRVPIRSRGQGQAQLALQRFLALTDEAARPVTLLASPLDKRTSLKRLVQLYAKFGFRPTGRRGNVAGDPVLERPVGGDAAGAREIRRS